MRIARVVGSAVATAKTPGLTGRALLIVQATSVTDEPGGETFVAVDKVGAGLGEVVLVAVGEAARLAIGSAVEIDAAVVGIIDRMDINGTQTYGKH